VKAIGYARVSTLEQVEAGVSLENQRERIEAWCVASGFALGRVYSETISGARASNRPLLQEALAEVCRERGVLVVYSLSRLARSVRDTLDVAERLERAGANLASLCERIDTSSAVGKMVFRMLSTLNEFERDQLAERTESAMAHLRRNGRRISGRVPYGYDLRADGRNLAPNGQEQEVLERLMELRAGGASFARIAGELEALGIPTKEGGSWHPATVRQILERRRKLMPLPVPSKAAVSPES
jgi:site-specific DNA recombinase